MVTFVSALLKSHVVFYDIIVDNKSATGKIKIYFFSRIKNVASKKAFGAILAVSLMWAVEPVLAKVEMRLSG